VTECASDCCKVRSRLVLDTLGVEHQALASLTSPGSVSVSALILLRPQEVAQGLVGRRLLLQPEIVLGEDELPTTDIK